MKRSLILLSAILTLLPAHAEELVQYDLRIDGITCPFCVATSEKALKQIDGIQLISSNLDTGIISVCGTNSLTLDDEQLTKLFRKKGFTYKGLTQVERCSINEPVSIAQDDLKKNSAEHLHSDSNEH